MTTNKVNFTERHLAGGWAKYLPAISGFYTTHLGKALADENFVPKERIPAKFELGIDGLDFLKEDAYFSYKFGLYSAGHAERKLDKCDDREPMIHKRDREKTILIGDSGGFQIATGVIKLDWKTVMTPAGDKLREEILRYLEHTADWSMTLDVPAFAALPPLSEKTGLTKFEDCLEVTEYNLKYFMKNRVPGATKFLNVLSGSDNENSKTWYERVIPYSIPDAVEMLGYPRSHTLEGWAFAGINMKNMRTVLERMLDLRRDGLLEGKDWIHFLGIGRLDWACYLTSIERLLRKYDNPNINISFDAASPFVAAGGYALSYNYNKFSPDQLTYAMGRGIDDKGLKGKTLAMPFQGPIMERLTTADMCVMGPGDLNKHGKEGKTSWDTTTYALVMAHNVYNHIQAIQEINRLADIEYATQEKVDFRDWYQSQHKKTKQNNKSNFVPNAIIYFNQFVEELFDPKTANPYNMLNEYSAFLDYVSFGDKKEVTSFNDLFGEHEEEEVHEIMAEDLASSDNEELIDLDE
jgi:hypothetical protein